MRVIAISFSGSIIATNVLNIILLHDIKDSEWGRLSPLKAHVWAGILLLGFAIPIVTFSVAFGLVQLSSK